MAELPKVHPNIYTQFNCGHFTVQKTKRVFSEIPIDQLRKQNIACVGVVGLTDNPSALQQWLISGPEVT